MNKTAVATYRFTAEEKKSGNVFNRPRFWQEEEAIQNRVHVHVLPDVVGVHTTADGLSQAEEHVFALKINKLLKEMEQQQQAIIARKVNFCSNFSS